MNTLILTDQIPSVTFPNATATLPPPDKGSNDSRNQGEYLLQFFLKSYLSKYLKYMTSCGDAPVISALWRQRKEDGEF
jgi:hypothetical protein